MKKVLMLVTFFIGTSAFGQDVFVVTADTTLNGVFDNCDVNGSCRQTEDMKQGKTKLLPLKQGQLVWISEVNGGVATVHFVSNKSRSLARYGTMDVSRLQKVANCQVSDILAKGTCL